MLDGAMIVWFTLTAGSLLFVIYDSLTNAPTSWVQRLAWILVVVYTGPVGLVMYLLTCRRPFPGGHDDFTRASWKQGVNSEMHCLAGDATGIIIAASIVPVFSLSNGWDVVIEYLAGFVCGLLIFQALMMIRMYDGNYLEAVRKTFFVETVSMNFVMLGMIPTMVILAHHWPQSIEPVAPSFWFRMSLASIVGGILAFPINWWLVRSHLKHGCMTLPGRDEPAPGLGNRSLERSRVMNQGEMAMPSGQAMGGHTDSAHASMPDMLGMSHDMKQGGGEHKGHAMTMRVLPTAQAAAWIVGTFILLLAAMLVTNQFAPITFDLP